MESKNSGTVEGQHSESAPDFWLRIWRDECKEQGGDEPVSSSQGYRKPCGMTSNIAKITRESTLAQVDGCPWFSDGKAYSKGVAGLHEEIEDFHKFMSPSYAEHQVRIFAVRRLQRFISRRWPHLRIEVFGSFCTGLYLPTSDIDIVLIGRAEYGCLYRLYDAFLNGDIADPHTIKLIQSTKVPVIKLTERMTKLKIDICLEVETGIKAAELIKESIKRYPTIPKLVLILKQFLLQRDLNGVFGGGLSSYSLILLTFSFLQQHQRESAKTPAANLGVLLIELLEFYSCRFNYQKVAIRIQNGGEYIPKEQVLHLQTADKPLISSVIAIEDPLEYGNDISNGSYKAQTVIDEFYAAFHVLSRATLTAAHEDDASPQQTRSSYLGLIIQITEAVMDYRKSCEALYSSLKEERRQALHPKFRVPRY